MKKTLIVIIVLLIILIFGQNIYYNIRGNNISSNILQENSTDIAGIENSLYIVGVLKIYQDYEPKMSIEKIQSIFYELVYENMPKINEDTKKLSNEKIREYYKKNKEKIDKMNITNEEDFFMICKQMQNVIGENVALVETRINTETIKERNNRINFDIILTYDNELEIIIGASLSKSSENIEFYSSSGLDKVFNMYTGNVSKQEILEKIDLFISNVNNLRYNSSLKTENEKTQYYDLNKDMLRNLGITSAEEFIKITSYINVMDWRYSDLLFENYKVFDETFRKEEYYYTFETVLYYNHGSSLELKIGISKTDNIEPRINISIYKEESE